MPVSRERAFQVPEWYSWCLGCSWWVSASPPCRAPCVFLANETWSTCSLYRDISTVLPILSQRDSVVIISHSFCCWCGWWGSWTPVSRRRRCWTQVSSTWGGKWLLMEGRNSTLAATTTSGFRTKAIVEWNSFLFSLKLMMEQNMLSWS